MNNILPISGMKRLLKKAKAKRISYNAQKALRDILEDYALTVSNKSILLAKHAGRKTINAEDIKLAIK